MVRALLESPQDATSKLETIDIILTLPTGETNRGLVVLANAALFYYLWFVHRTGTGDFEMAQRKRRIRRGWSAQDVRELKALARQSVPAKSIGRKLKRTEGAVRQKAFSLGTSLNTKARARAK